MVCFIIPLAHPSSGLQNRHVGIHLWYDLVQYLKLGVYPGAQALGSERWEPEEQAQ